MSLERLWATWRSDYVASIAQAPPPTGDQSLFEGILASGLSDEESGIVWRGRHAFSLLNLYPYTSGHVLVLPYRAVPDLGGLTDEEAADLWLGIRSAEVAITSAYSPDGVNIGMNIGRAAGAGVPDHLHAHVLPRWAGDTNFTTAIAEVRLLPESLDITYRRLTEAWPDHGGR
ncbi:MAG: HIT domain-containing protein [Acidimicrobiia bacterium]|nr:HIT domain-containing protein [Acidimicrobiia bacterium]